jgi:FG-GAP-like repeat
MRGVMVVAALALGCNRSPLSEQPNDLQANDLAALDGNGDMAVEDQSIPADAISSSDIAYSCSDGVKNGSETDIDCGGSACVPCVAGKACLHANDCSTTECLNNVCITGLDGGRADAGLTLATFASAAPFGAGTTPIVVKLADFDHDGKLDVAALNRDSHDVSVLLGAGDGTLGGPTNTTVFSTSVAGLGVGLFDNDQLADVIVTGSDGPTSTAKLLLGKGDGNFSSPAPYYSCANDGSNVCPGKGVAGELAVGFLSGAAHPDVAVSLAGIGNLPALAFLGVLKATNNGSYQPLTPMQSGPTNTSQVGPLAIADFDGDKNLDIAQVNGNSATTAHLLVGNGDGTFSVSGDINVGSNGSTGVSTITAGDFNNDGKMDIAGVDLSFTVFPGKGDGSFKAGKSTPVGGQGVAVATGDFNSDGKLDAVVANWSGASVTVLTGRGDGTFVATVVGSGTMPRSVAVGDLNGDNKPDIVVADQSVVIVLLNTTH